MSSLEKDLRNNLFPLDSAQFYFSVRDVAETCGFRVVPDFCGHGIGEYFHGPPDILHYSKSLAFDEIH